MILDFIIQCIDGLGRKFSSVRLFIIYYIAAFQFPNNASKASLKFQPRGKDDSYFYTNKISALLWSYNSHQFRWLTASNTKAELCPSNNCAKIENVTHGLMLRVIFAENNRRHRRKTSPRRTPRRSTRVPATRAPTTPSRRNHPHPAMLGTVSRVKPGGNRSHMHNIPLTHTCKCKHFSHSCTPLGVHTNGIRFVYVP